MCFLAVSSQLLKYFIPTLCDPPPGLLDQEEPRRLFAGHKLPLLSLPTQCYRPRSNKVTTKGGGIHFTHPRAVYEGWEGGEV